MRFRNRHPMLYLATLGAVVMVHFLLCYPASVSRGYPPMDPFWEFIAIYLAFLGPAIAPVFEDFCDCPKLRVAFLSMFAVAAAIILAVPLANIAGARPRIGHLAGYFGVWRYEFVCIVFKAIQASVIAIPFVLCLESVARSFWDQVRTLPPTTVD